MHLFDLQERQFSSVSDSRRQRCLPTSRLMPYHLQLFPNCLFKWGISINNNHSFEFYCSRLIKKQCEWLCVICECVRRIPLVCVALMSELKCLLSCREGLGPRPTAGESVQHERVQMYVLAGCEFLVYSNRAAQKGTITALPVFSATC